MRMIVILSSDSILCAWAPFGGPPLSKSQTYIAESMNKTDSKEQKPRAPLSEPVVESRELLKGGRGILILHGNEVYRLKLTNSNKLILTK